MSAENRKPRLHRLDRVFVHSPIYFVTACTHERRKILATAKVHEAFLDFARRGPEHGAWVGAYVIMPDHLHVFVSVDDQRIMLSVWMKSLKNTASKALRLHGTPPPHWQKTFLVTCFAVENPIQKSGVTFVKIRNGQGLYQRPRIGRSWARSLHWNIIPSDAVSAVTDRRYNGTIATGKICAPKHVLRLRRGKPGRLACS